ncbi:MAG: hypothetical protein GY873_30275 [Bosea sp.]|uniref:hypothetical protein n=1 Tax=Bosea sp. (in: a-proteobacteria) TaxID=1871050 RepID=UPI00238AAFEE|nr:hypothetical protein [Bosea sp. (in: a-proteobacteria)]MCP4738483.1 hypothetical protein [Bosea sp. (in: a-proteobacteria)]
MRHFRPEPGQPTQVDEVNAALLKAKLIAEPLAFKARQALGRGDQLGPVVADIVVADMVDLLDEGRIARGYADVQDLVRAGYDHHLAWTRGTQAAKILARRVAARAEAAETGQPAEAEAV